MYVFLRVCIFVYITFRLPVFKPLRLMETVDETVIKPWKVEAYVFEIPVELLGW